jgi:hypothetical protein
VRITPCDESALRTGRNDRRLALYRRIDNRGELGHGIAKFNFAHGSTFYLT